MPDYQSNPDDSTLFIHRTLKDGEIYFISNQTKKVISINPTFRVKGKKPELWDAVSGSIRNLPAFTFNASGTSVPIKLEPSQSLFIVFKKTEDHSNSMGVLSNFPSPVRAKEITGDWQVNFNYKMRGPKNTIVFNGLTDWSQNKNDSIKYYSGTTVYSKTFKISKPGHGEKIFIDLGNLIAMARAKVNGIDVGGAWTPPYEVDITNAVKSGENKLEISVVNTWVNRLIGDLNLPEAQRKTWININPYKAGSPLQTSGLLGPVVLKIMQY